MSKRQSCLLLIKDTSLESLKILRFIDANLPQIKAAGLYIKIVLIKSTSLDDDMVSTLRNNGFDTFPTFVPAEASLKAAPMTNFSSIKNYLQGHMKRAELSRVGNEATLGYDLSSGNDLSMLSPNYSKIRSSPNNTLAGIDDYDTYQRRQMFVTEGGLGKVDDDAGIGEDDFGKNFQDKITRAQTQRQQIQKNNPYAKKNSALANMVNGGGNQGNTLSTAAPFTIPQARGLSLEEDEEDNIGSYSNSEDKKMLEKVGADSNFDDDDIAKNWMINTGGE